MTVTNIFAVKQIELKGHFPYMISAIFASAHPQTHIVFPSRVSLVQRGDDSPGLFITGPTACHEEVGSTSPAGPAGLDAALPSCLFLLY